MSVPVIVQRLLLFFVAIACYVPAYAQLPCCQLQLASGSPFAAGGTFPRAIAFSPTRNCLAVANISDNSVTVFRVNSDCSLDVLNTYGMSSGVGLVPISLAFSSDGNCLAVANNVSNNISVFTVNDDCSLTPAINSPFPVAPFINPIAVAFSPNGNCLAVINESSNNVSVFTVNPDCSLNVDTVQTYSVGTSPQSVAFSPSGTCLVVANGGDEINTGTVSVFAVDSATCELTPVGNPVSTQGVLPFSVSFSPNGNCLAVANRNSSTVSVFTVDPATCNLTPATNSPFPVLPPDTPIFSVAFSSSNECLAVTTGVSSIAVFTVDPVTCSLTPAANSPFSIDPPASGAFGLAFSPINNCLAVTNQTSATVSMFSLLIVQQPNITTITSNCSTAIVTGISSPNATITLFIDGNQNSTGLADGSGNFSIETTPLAIGTYSITASASLLDCVSSISAPVETTIGLQQPLIMSAMVTDNFSITVVGTADPNVTITLFVDSSPNATGTTDESGNFTIETTPLPAGMYTITAVATAPGCTSSASEPVSVTTNQTTTISVAVGCGNFVTIIGTSTPNSTVNITIDNVQVATVTTNSDGIFVFAGIQLFSGMHCITATDIANNYTSVPVCIDVSPLSCVLGGPNLAFGTHCNS